MIGAVLVAAFQGGLLVLQAGLADLDAPSAGRAPVWAVTYLTPDGEIDALPLEGNVCIRDKDGNDVVVMGVENRDGTYIRTYVKFAAMDAATIRQDFSEDGKKFDMAFRIDYRQLKYREDEYLAGVAVDAMKIYSDVCNW
ncbi:MAG: hypothetical protein KDJ88_13530 [Bauldia sp.]|nr:hypothetical protein [Bauldia sp.]